MQSRNRQVQAGFTLIEILIVVVIIGIIAAISVTYLIPAIRGTKDNLAKNHLTILAEAQSRYRVGLGRGRYATLKDLAETVSNTGEKLVPETILKFDSSSTSVPAEIDGWKLIEESGNLRRQFGFIMHKSDKSLPAYFIAEDGVFRKCGSPEPNSCSRSSEPAK